MNRHRQNPESVAIQRIDSGKRRSEDRAREAQVLAHARVATVVAIMAVPANDRVRHMEGMLDAIREQLTASLDPAGASSIIAAKAQQASLDMSFQEVGALLASGKARIKQMRLVLWSMLLEHHENVTEEDVGQIMDEAGHEAAGEAIGAAFVAAMPQAREADAGDGEARPQTAAPAAKKTGKGSGTS